LLDDSTWMTYNDPMAKPQPLAVGRQLATPRRLLATLGSLAAVAAFAIFLGKGRWESVALWSVYWICVTVRLWRPVTTLTEAGIRRPWRRRTFVVWADIESIVPTQPGERFVRLVLTDGSSLALSDVSPDQAPRIAAAGGTPMVDAVPVRPAPPQEMPVSEQQRAADADRRIRQLERERAVMLSQSKPLRPAHINPTSGTFDEPRA